MNTPALPDISTLDAHLGFWLRFVSNQVSGQFEARLAAHGMSVSEWVALRVLYGRSDVTHARLIETLGMTKGAASKIMSRLEAKGLAKRSPAGDRLREQVLQLTEAGERLTPVLAALADENDAAFFGHLPEAQRQDLMTLMQSLVAYHRLQNVPLE